MRLPSVFIGSLHRKFAAGVYRHLRRRRCDRRRAGLHILDRFPWLPGPRSAGYALRLSRLNLAAGAIPAVRFVQPNRWTTFLMVHLERVLEKLPIIRGNQLSNCSLPSIWPSCLHFADQPSLQQSEVGGLTRSLLQSWLAATHRQLNDLQAVRYVNHMTFFIFAS